MSCVYMCVCIPVAAALPRSFVAVYSHAQYTRTASRVHFLAQHKSMLPIYVCLCKGSTSYVTIGLLFQPRRAQALWLCVGLHKA